MFVTEWLMIQAEHPKLFVNYFVNAAGRRWERRDQTEN